MQNIVIFLKWLNGWVLRDYGTNNNPNGLEKQEFIVWTLHALNNTQSFSFCNCVSCCDRLETRYGLVVQLVFCIFGNKLVSCYSFMIKSSYVLQECNIEEIDEDEVSKGSKDSKKKGGDDSGKGPSLVFKITSKVQYKTVLKGNPFLYLFINYCKICCYRF